jgi:uncharacterized protein (DUF305 family)
MCRPPIYLLASAMLGAALTMSTFAGATDEQDKSPPAHSMSGHSAGSMELHRIMSEGRNMSMPMSGDVDKDFASMMSMHHQQGIKMIDVLLQHGQNAELKEFARKMKAEQETETRELARFKQ